MPAAVTVGLLRKAMKDSGKSRFLIDGFPRSPDNLAAWEEAAAGGAVIFDFALFLDCPEEVKRCMTCICVLVYRDWQDAYDMMGTIYFTAVVYDREEMLKKFLYRANHNLFLCTSTMSHVTPYNIMWTGVASVMQRWPKKGGLLPVKFITSLCSSRLKSCSWCKPR